MASLKGDGKMIFTIFIGAIIAVVLLGSIANAVVGQTTNKVVANETVTLPAVNQTLEVTGRSLIGAITIINSSGGDISSTWIRDTRLGTNGLSTVAVTANDSSFNIGNASTNLSYLAVPDGHAIGSGDRSIILLITLFGALAALVFVIAALFGGSIGELIRRR